MTENKRFLIDDAGELIDLNNRNFIDYGDECCKLLNELNDENQELKKKNKQLSIDFMDFKMKLIEQLQIHYDYASEQRQKNLCDPFVAQAYDIIRYDVRKLAEGMRVDLE